MPKNDWETVCTITRIQQDDGETKVKIACCPEYAIRPLDSAEFMNVFFRDKTEELGNQIMSARYVAQNREFKLEDTQIIGILAGAYFTKSLIRISADKDLSKITAVVVEAIKWPEKSKEKSR